MNGWFLALIIIGVLNIGIHIAKQGEKKVSEYNFLTALFGLAIEIIIVYMAIVTGF